MFPLAIIDPRQRAIIYRDHPEDSRFLYHRAPRTRRYILDIISTVLLARRSQRYTTIPTKLYGIQKEYSLARYKTRVIKTVTDSLTNLGRNSNRFYYRPTPVEGKRSHKSINYNGQVNKRGYFNQYDRNHGRTGSGSLLNVFLYTPRTPANDHERPRLAIYRQVLANRLRETIDLATIIYRLLPPIRQSNRASEPRGRTDYANVHCLRLGRLDRATTNNSYRD